MTTIMLPIRRSDLVTRILDGEAVILDRTAGRIHQLNATASCIWNACDGTHSPADIATHVAARFDHSADAILHDVVTTLADLQQLGLVIDGQQG